MKPKNQTEEQLTTDQRALSDSLKNKYGINTTFMENGNVHLNYEDGKKVIIKSEDNRYVLTGSKINNQTFGIEVEEGEEKITQRVHFYDNKNFSAQVSKQEFMKSVHGSFLKEKESFDECFEREWEDFCDGAASCIARDVLPISSAAVATAVAIHCA
ncbi:MAG: hypothetical protein ACQESN_11320 [Thermotogota bacterium]